MRLTETKESLEDEVGEDVQEGKEVAVQGLHEGWEGSEAAQQA